MGRFGKPWWHKLVLNTGALVTSLTSSVTGNLWQGIECRGSGWAGPHAGGLVQINGGTIEYATCAYTHYDPALGFQNGFGRLHAQNATFRNNILCLEIGNTWYMPSPRFNDAIDWIGNYTRNSEFLLTADFPYTVPDMINMFGAGLILHSCNFNATNNYFDAMGNYVSNYTFANNTTAINAQLSIIWLEKLLGNLTGCDITGFKNGLLVNNGSSISYNTIVSNSQFLSVNAINISGSANPMFKRHLR